MQRRTLNTHVNMLSKGCGVCCVHAGISNFTGPPLFFQKNNGGPDKILTVRHRLIRSTHRPHRGGVIRCLTVNSCFLMSFFWMSIHTFSYFHSGSGIGSSVIAAESLLPVTRSRQRRGGAAESGGIRMRRRVRDML